MNQLPSGWALADIDDIKANSPNALAIGPFGSNLKVSDYRDSGVPLVFVRNIRARAFDTSDLKFVSRAKAESLRAHHVTEGDLLVTKMGDPPGDVAIYPLHEEGIITADCIKLTPHTSINTKYLMYALRTPAAKRQIIQITQGVAQPKMSLARFRHGVQIPLAPSAEQNRIVAAIEEQFSRIDAGVAALERARQNLKRMRARGVSSLFDPLRPRVPLIDVLTLISDCPHRTPTYTEGEGYPALRPRDVVGGELRLETSARVSAQEYRLQTVRHTPEAGDIVYSRELSYGWAVELPEKPLVCLSQGMVILRTSKLLPGFLALFLNSHEGRQQADRAATGTAHPHINIRDIKQYQVPLASHTDQRKVIAKASGLLSDCDRVSQSVAVGIIRASALRNAVLSRAFSGQLVPQDRDDEPLAVVLERIAAERASYNGHKAGRTRKPRLLGEDAST